MVSVWVLSTTLVFDEVMITLVELFEYAGRLEPFINSMATKASSPTNDCRVFEGEMERAIRFGVWPVPTDWRFALADFSPPDAAVIEVVPGFLVVVTFTRTYVWPAVKSTVGGTVATLLSDEERKTVVLDSVILGFPETSSTVTIKEG